jgi:hypothetical protein
MTTSVLARTPLPTERRFYTGMALAILAAVLVGFSRTFFLRPLFPGFPSPAETIFYVHGSLFAAWIALLVFQTSLVAAGHTAVHRRIGTLGAALAAAMVVVGTIGALIAARRSTGFVGVPVPPLQFLAIPLFDMALFALFAGLAIAQRRNPQSHKRLMLLATLNLVTAAVARWPGVLPLGPLGFFGITDLFLVPLAAWDLRTRGRLHPVTLWGGLLMIASQPLRLVVSSTDGWLAFARWATGLLG